MSDDLPMILTPGEMLTTLLDVSPPREPGETAVTRLVDALNAEEPFAIRFQQDGDNITFSFVMGVHLLNWIRRYNQRMTEFQ